MKNLTITYGDQTLFSGDVQEITWTDSDTAISITGKIKAAAGGQGFMDLLAAMAKQQTEKDVENRKLAFEQEKSHILDAE